MHARPCCHNAGAQRHPPVFKAHDRRGNVVSSAVGCGIAKAGAATRAHHTHTCQSIQRCAPESRSKVDAACRWFLGAGHAGCLGAQSASGTSARAKDSAVHGQGIDGQTMRRQGNQASASTPQKESPEQKKWSPELRRTQEGRLLCHKTECMLRAASACVIRGSSYATRVLNLVLTTSTRSWVNSWLYACSFIITRLCVSSEFRPVH